MRLLVQCQEATTQQLLRDADREEEEKVNPPDGPEEVQGGP